MVVICIRLARIEYSWSGLTAFRNGKKTDYRWSEVSRVLKVPFWTPPIYRVSFTNGDPPIYFGMSWWTISIGFWSWDFSGFQNFANTMIEAEKKKQKDVNQSLDSIGTSSAGPDRVS